MKRAASAALWFGPLVLCLVLYWPGLLAWFQGDDFAWLNLAYDVRAGKPLTGALFEPKAQGTFRVLSERAFFLAFYNLFGLDALPFRAAVFITVGAALLLLNSIARRLTGSAAAGFWAAVLWVVNVGLPVPMTLSAMYNQLLCAFFVLLAFRWLSLYVKTGRKRYYWAQWAAYVAGFGALESMVMYPVLAGAYTWLFARRHFRAVLPMFAASALYVGVNRYFAPPAAGLYAMQFDLGVFSTLARYWQWTAGGSARLSSWMAVAGAALLAVGVAWFVVLRARRRDWLPVLFVLWYAALLAPYLPLRRHVSDYYITLPATGIALLGAYALVRAPRYAAPFAVLYLAAAIPTTAAGTRFFAERSWRARNLLAGVARAAQLHPGKTILLTDVDSNLFYTAVLDNPFRLVGAPKVYLAPGSERKIPALAGIGDPAPYTVPAPVARRAMQTWSAVVYSAAGPRLKNITGTYWPPASAELPHTVNLANPLTDYLLGESWYEASATHRWMGRRGTLRLAGGARLRVTAASIHKTEVTVYASGIKLGTRRVGKGEVNLEFALPDSLRGRGALEVAIEVNPTIRPPEDGRELGLAFGTVEVK